MISEREQTWAGAPQQKVPRTGCRWMMRCSHATGLCQAEVMSLTLSPAALVHSRCRYYWTARHPHSHDVNTKYNPNAKINMLHLNLNVNQQWSSKLAGSHLINTCDACVHFAADVETKLRVKWRDECESDVSVTEDTQVDPRPVAALDNTFTV